MYYLYIYTWLYTCIKCVCVYVFRLIYILVVTSIIEDIEPIYLPWVPSWQTNQIEDHGNYFVENDQFLSLLSYFTFLTFCSKTYIFLWYFFVVDLLFVYILYCMYIYIFNIYIYVYVFLVHGFWNLSDHL